MKPNQYGAVLDWKLEAVSTRIYWFPSVSPVPSSFSAQALPLRPGSKDFTLQQGLRCSVPSWARLLCSQRRTRPVGDLCFPLTLSHLGTVDFVMRTISRESRRFMGIFRLNIDGMDVVGGLGEKAECLVFLIRWLLSARIAKFTIMQQGLNLDRT